MVIYCVQSFVNMILLIILLRLHKRNAKEEWKVLFKKPKTWIFVLALALNFIFFLRYMLNFPKKVDLFFLFVEQAVRFAIFVLVFIYFIKSSTSLIGRGKELDWRKRFDLFTEVTGGIWIFFALASAYFIISAGPDSKYPCKNYLFIATEMMLMVLCIGFIFFGY